LVVGVMLIDRMIRLHHYNFDDIILIDNKYLESRFLEYRIAEYSPRSYAECVPVGTDRRARV